MVRPSEADHFASSSHFFQLLMNQDVVLNLSVEGLRGMMQPGILIDDLGIHS